MVIFLDLCYIGYVDFMLIRIFSFNTSCATACKGVDKFVRAASVMRVVTRIERKRTSTKHAQHFYNN